MGQSQATLLVLSPLVQDLTSLSGSAQHSARHRLDERNTLKALSILQNISQG